MAETMTSSSKQGSAASSSERNEVLTDLERQRKQADQRVRPALEAQRAEQQQAAEKVLDQEAIAAIQQTERALNAIAEERIDEALAAIEQATGKIDILLSRNPSTALIPVDVQVELIDTAPADRADIVVLRNAAGVAMDMNDLPTTRALLDTLRSEIRVRTYHLPLATYPAALQDAARLLDQKDLHQAGGILLLALNTLVAIDRVTALPFLTAKQAIDEAESQKDRQAAQTLLDVAERELERALELGYVFEDADYKAMKSEVKDLRKKMKGNENTSSVFNQLRTKLASLIHHQSEKQTQNQVNQRPQKAA